MAAPETLIRIPALPEEYIPLVFCAYTAILALHTHTSLPPTVGKKSFPTAFSQHHHESLLLVLFEHAYFIHGSDEDSLLFSLSSAALESRSFMGFIRESTCQCRFDTAHPTGLE